MNYEAWIEYRDRGWTHRLHVTFQAVAGDMEDAGFQAGLTFAKNMAEHELSFDSAQIASIRSEIET